MRKHSILILSVIAVALVLLLLYGIFDSASNRYNKSLESLNENYNSFINEVSDVTKEINKDN